MPENLGPILTDQDLPTKKFVVDQVATAEEVAITAGVTPNPVRELWVDTAASSLNISREEFDALVARVAALEVRA